jgi:cytoskeletal protein CcmA (bactofilin family)
MFASPRRTDARPAPARTAAQSASHLGTALKISGTLEATGDLHIHAHVTGRINADRLIIERDGFVEGDIVANDVRIAGKLVGRVFAPTVSIDETADITGRIFHTNVTAARGHKLEGRMPWRPESYFRTLDQLPEPTT